MGLVDDLIKQAKEAKEREEAAKTMAKAQHELSVKAVKDYVPPDMEEYEKAKAEIEKQKKELEEKQREAERKLQELQAEHESKMRIVGGNGIVMDAEDIKRAEEIIKIREEQAREEEARRNAPPKPPFIPNKYLLFREKMELAEIMRFPSVETLRKATKSFLDSRHKIIYDVLYQAIWDKKSIETPENLIAKLKERNFLELAGGEEFIHDIFDGLHDRG